MKAHNLTDDATLLNPAAEAIAFLKQLRPSGPWVLTAIKPDGPVTTITARTEQDVDRFVTDHNGKRNIYFAVNPTRDVGSKKAAKVDVTAIEFLLSDLDPRDGETSEAAKARYLAALAALEWKPTGLIDSGNGIQGLWKLDRRIDLPETVIKDGKRELSGEALAIITDVEKKSAALMERLGSVAGTQNIDRILRLPGTINLPNEKKRNAGRVECRASLLHFNGASYPLAAFEVATDSTPDIEVKGESFAEDDDSSDDDTSDDDTSDDEASTADKPRAAGELDHIIKTGDASRFKGDRSRAVWFLITTLLKHGHRPEAVQGILLDRKNGISAHIYDQSNPHKYAKQQVAKAVQQIDFTSDKDGKLYKSHDNGRIAMLKMGLEVRHDEFADVIEITGLKGHRGPLLNDKAVLRFRMLCEQEFRLLVSKDMAIDVLFDVALLNSFHPVREYLRSLHWDGTPRIDKWLNTYAGAPDNKYVQAVGALWLTAAVRRIRQPGCKFDEMLILECPTQGTDKSSALKILAVKEKWFTDNLSLNTSSKEVIEAIQGHWIIEVGELHGMNKATDTYLKGLVARQVDKARLSYDRIRSDIPRQSVFAGTTNEQFYFRDPTGNRRYWPVRVERFKLEDLRRDRDQLWAEAAQREASGASIRLKEELWSVAAEEQQQRLPDEPLFETLRDHIGDREGKIMAEDAWKILNIDVGQRPRYTGLFATAMKNLGWIRPSKSSNTLRFQRRVKIGGRWQWQATGPRSAYVRGEAPHVNTIRVNRDVGGLYVWEERDNTPPDDPELPF